LNGLERNAVKKNQLKAPYVSFVLSGVIIPIKDKLSSKYVLGNRVFIHSFLNNLKYKNNYICKGNQFIE
jgi:hypothetical protein